MVRIWYEFVIRNSVDRRPKAANNIVGSQSSDVEDRRSTNNPMNVDHSVNRLTNIGSLGSTSGIPHPPIENPTADNRGTEHDTLQTNHDTRHPTLREHLPGEGGGRLRGWGWGRTGSSKLGQLESRHRIVTVSVSV